ncbi:serine/threonine-protein kinase [Streptomyces triticirhizae]|uniref:non-specific serine/threonine protein kinase n=1 Tax=Streptomyces triticirhizae TaxID=2483353 RepID=A0A3M2LLG4_9ACTN|nr:serine/threonine-protein kinase [Streptomyces triticirhizae]RMI37353.1 serine/threonine protein kinase [Streptomyces triticirhizae]
MAGAERGQIIDGRFELLRRLGRGGMGTVWCARDVALHREVALKEVRPREDPEGVGHVPPPEVLRERVLREARALARLTHPHVVRIYHIVDVAPHPWLVMELLPGETLHTRARGGPVAPADVIRWGRDVLSALRAAHAAGIHHRDIKPANILLREDGSAVLTDFGIAALSGAPSSLTATGGIVGSPEYLAPERIRGAPDDPAADLWSLGITLYILTEGHSPLRRETTLATLTAVLEDPIPPPVRSGPLTGALTALLQRDPAARPNAEALDAMLAEAARLATGQPPAPVAPVPTQQDLPLPAPPPGTPTPPATPTPTPTQSPTPTPTAPTTTAGPPAPPGGGRSRGLLAVAVVASALLLVGTPTAWVLLRDGEGGEERVEAGPTVGPTDDASAPTPEEEKEDQTPPSPVESDTETEPEPTPEESEEPEPTPEETEETTEPEPEPDPEPDGRWVAQLFSEPVGTGVETRDRRLAAVRADVPEAEVLLSDDYASLNPGYWVIYAPGPFADGRAAVARCAEAGLTTRNECVGRYLSQDPADLALICDPSGGGSGRCAKED